MEPFINPSAPDAYHHLYSGKTLLLKVSGAELSSPSFPRLTQDITQLTRFGIRFLLFCGAGDQNTFHFNAYLQQQGLPHCTPVRVGGRRVTSYEELTHGVLPASQAIRSQILELLPDATILDPEQIHCMRIPALGYVGDPQHIDGLTAGSIVAIPSVGSDGESLLNINADDAARIATQQGGIDEAIFFTPTGGVINTAKGGKIAPLLWSEDIADDGTHASIDVTGGGGGMQKKLQEVKRMLSWVEKVVITGLQGVRSEVELLFGSGTLVISKKSLRCKPLTTEDEWTIYQRLYDMHAQRGEFKMRSPEELAQLRDQAYLLGVGNSVLGAYALVPKEQDWKELATVCSEYNGASIGDILLQSAKNVAQQQRIKHMYSIASSPAMASLLQRNGFVLNGTIADLQRGDSAGYCHLSWVPSYDTQKRGRPTSLYTWHAQSSDDKPHAFEE